MDNNFQMNTYIDLCFFSIYQDKLCVLLVKRANEPFSSVWALPGGIWESNLNPDDAATNTMFRKTGLRDIYLEQLQTYGGIGRDPRGPSVSVAYLGLVNYDKLGKTLHNNEDLEMKWCPISEIPRLAFDHNKMVDDAQKRIINKLQYTKVGFELVGKEFTIQELCSTFEDILGYSIDASNLRKKLTSLKIIKEVKNPNIKNNTGRGRKSTIYQLDEAIFNRMPSNERFF